MNFSNYSMKTFQQTSKIMDIVWKKNMISRFISERTQLPNITLGRWSLTQCDKKNEIKVYQANMDHCGTCS